MTARLHEQEWTTLDRSRWGAGPWDAEPDKASWTDASTSRPCLAVRNAMGAWCGYVAVDPGHPLHGRNYEVPDVDVHGGLTYADRCMDGDSVEASGICHVPQPGQPHDVWWFGFDTCHAGDEYPFDTARPRYGTYRTLAYVQAECASLAQQLSAPVAPTEVPATGGDPPCAQPGRSDADP